MAEEEIPTDRFIKEGKDLLTKNPKDWTEDDLEKWIGIINNFRNLQSSVLNKLYLPYTLMMDDMCSYYSAKIPDEERENLLKTPRDYNPLNFTIAETPFQKDVEQIVKSTTRCLHEIQKNVFRMFDALEIHRRGIFALKMKYESTLEENEEFLKEEEKYKLEEQIKKLQKRLEEQEEEKEKEEQEEVDKSTTKKKQQKKIEKRCKKCGHEWTPKVKNPKTCPKCHNPNWEDEENIHG